MPVALSNADSADRFLNLAFDDLNSARLLYEEQIYPQAVFHLQQAVEKAIKSLGLYIGIITEEQAKKEIGHKGLVLFEKTTDHLANSLLKIGKVIREHPELKQITEITTYDFTDLEKKSQEFSDKFHQILKETDRKKIISSEELHSVFNQLDELNRNLEAIKKGIEKNPFTDEEINRKKQEYLDQLQPLFRYFPDKKDEIENNINSLLNQLKNRDFLIGVILPIAEISCAAMSLYHLTIITQPHAMTARYPDGEFNPAEFYTEQNPLIQEFPRLMDYIYQSLSLLDRVYGFLPIEVAE
jgi:HEPN domain-containing protein